MNLENHQSLGLTPMIEKPQLIEDFGQEESMGFLASTGWLLGRLFGFTCCREFTPWEIKSAKYTRIPKDLWEQGVTNVNGYVEYELRWQQRQCTVCGKIQQKKLKY